MRRAALNAPLKLNLCSIGDPRSPRTWSGTPSNIHAELARRGRAGEAFDVTLPRWQWRALSLASVPLYGRFDVGRAPLRRHACAARAARLAAAAESAHTLHMGTLTLPFRKVPAGQHHYLFCDSTWDLWSRHATNMERYTGRQVALFDRLERRCYEQVEHIFPISEYVRQNLIAHYGVPPGKVTVVGTGLGVIRPFTGVKDHAARRILFVAKGRFEDKGGDLVMAAFAKARETDPGLRLTVVGSEHAMKYAGDPGVTVLGFIPLGDLQALFDTHSLLLMPALNEPWGLVYLEAMACKMPIMGLARNSLPELSGHGRYGFVIDEADPAAIARMLVDAFADTARLKLMGEQAQARCLEQFTWARTVDRILEVIERNASHE